MMVRVAPELHAKAAVAAKSGGVSLNQWVAQTLARAVEA
jgi:predicted HicB family RNase H-like nuclease